MADVTYAVSKMMSHLGLIRTCKALQSTDMKETKLKTQSWITWLPNKFALGPALKAASNLIKSTGGKVEVISSTLQILASEVKKRSEQGILNTPKALSYCRVKIPFIKHSQLSVINYK
ncbi:BBT_HP_G0132120.mRNA.1.CDS.1 [Saccharomyces cerevisiae]|nr:BBT_HP_G0132120.mRNA.1.CDS.1 [Saccharomyces cerevisiae]CAI6975786.1 BBT_HP_G0132120.mRNA.1.CDS.1 [Saccharomyces cerevisiae]